ncbi:hypothetical protein [Erwinia mallotivora]|uniref:hypothetical protein n=1 Tax=Erwinia mallotivora TaxID=69222 RepID=UPI0036D2BD52
MLLDIIKNKHNEYGKKISALALLTKLVLLSFPFSQAAWAEQSVQHVESKENSTNRKVKFNTGFLTAFNKDIDLSWLENETGIQPGRYILEVFLRAHPKRSYRIMHHDNF